MKTAGTRYEHGPSRIRNKSATHSTAEWHGAEEDNDRETMKSMKHNATFILYN
jgi:hypothetical protein